MKAAASGDTLLDSAFEFASDTVTAARRYLASEQGRKARRAVAAAVIVGAPIISELPLVRRSWAARVLRTAAIGTILIKGAEWLRDWEPSTAAEGPPFA